MVPSVWTKNLGKFQIKSRYKGIINHTHGLTDLYEFRNCEYLFLKCCKAYQNLRLVLIEF